MAAINEAGSIAIFMDNLRVHHSRLVRARLGHLDIASVFNIAYSPKFNPIELVFGKLKHAFKKERLGHLSRGERFGFLAAV